ncbi:MAG: hypothetical protein Kow0069_23560 [Promethearchaeota archaeon]
MKFLQDALNDCRNALKSFDRLRELVEPVLRDLALEASPESFVKTSLKDEAEVARELVESTGVVNTAGVVERALEFVVLLPNSDATLRFSTSLPRRFAVVARHEEDLFGEFRSCPRGGRAESRAASTVQGATEFQFGSSTRSTAYALRLASEVPAPVEVGGEDADLRDLTFVVSVRTFAQQALASNLPKVSVEFLFSRLRPHANLVTQVASLLELAGRGLDDLDRQTKFLESEFGSYLEHEALVAEREKLARVVEALPGSFDATMRLAKLMVAADEDWTAVEKLLQQYHDRFAADLNDRQLAKLLKLLGWAKCMRLRLMHTSHGYKEGQEMILKSIKLDPLDPDAYCVLGGTYKRQREWELATRAYAKALEVDGGYPYALVNYLPLKMLGLGSVAPVEDNEQRIEEAIRRRSLQVRAEVDFPWAFFDIGTLCLLRASSGNQSDLLTSLANFINGIRTCTETWMLETTIATLENLEPLRGQLPGYDQVIALLSLGLLYASRPGTSSYEFAKGKLAKVLSDGPAPTEVTSGPAHVVLLAGTTKQVPAGLQSIGVALRHCLSGGTGVLVCRGLSTGVHGLACDLAADPQMAGFSCLAYVPRLVPSQYTLDARATRRVCPGEDFNLIQAIQFWYDLHEAKVPPGRVKVVGVGGGHFTALEYRLAMVLGAQLGVVAGSGLAADSLINNAWWFNEEKRWFKVLDGSADSFANFFTRPFVTDPDVAALRRVLFYDSSGTCAYDLDLYHEERTELFTGMFVALQNFANELQLGQTMQVKASEGVLFGARHPDPDYRVTYVLWEHPRPQLEEKLLAFFDRFVREALVPNHEVLSTGRVINDVLDPVARELLLEVFGPEVLKLLDH